MEYASKGVANAGLTTGIIGTALGVLNNGGLLGNILGGCANTVCSDDHFVNRYEAKQSNEIAELKSQIALRDANVFTDQKVADVFERLSTRISGLEKEVYANTCSQAVTNQKLSDNISFVDSKFEGVYKDIATANRELKCYVDGNFVPGKLVMPLDAICPPAQPASTTPTTAA